MKATPTEYEALQVLGLPDTYLAVTPAELWTREAFDLFKAAQEAGIIELCWELDCWTAGPGLPPAKLAADLNNDIPKLHPERITKGRLAYFCKRACWRLHLNNGAHTNWLPFEAMFNYKPGTMRRYLHNVEERYGSLEDPYIDAFFESVKIYK